MSRKHYAPTNLALRKKALQGMLKAQGPKRRGRFIPRNQEASYQDQASIPGTIR